jgi:hypothetical protein
LTLGTGDLEWIVHHESRRQGVDLIFNDEAMADTSSARRSEWRVLLTYLDTVAERDSKKMRTIRQEWEELKAGTYTG